jgi:hypothetical protein
MVSGKSQLPIFHNAIQRLLFDSLKLADIEAAKATAAPKTVPPVQRPGTPKPVVTGNVQQLQALEKKLPTATGSRAIEISAQIYALRKKAASR